MQGAHILLIEDEYILCNLISRNLRARNHEVSITDTVQGALEHLRSAHFDLLVLDINLSDKTGWDVLRTACREGYLSPQKVDSPAWKLPVVILSAVRIGPARLAEFHPLAYLPKPFPMDALLRLAAEAAHRKHEGLQEPGIPQEDRDA